jgi:hypothetical protein
MLYVSATYTCCMTMLHILAACPCCMSLRHVLAAYPAACLCCMTMQHVSAACLCCMSVLLVHTAQLHVHDACSCCMSILHVCMYIRAVSLHQYCMSMLQIMSIVHVHAAYLWNGKEKLEAKRNETLATSRNVSFCFEVNEILKAKWSEQKQKKSASLFRQNKWNECEKNPTSLRSEKKNWSETIAP